MAESAIPTPAIKPNDAAALQALRAEIDALDDRLHDLLMERARIIERVKRDGGKRGVMIRPGREARMLRRLLARHQGALPPQTIIRIWRELFTGALTIEGGLTIAVDDKNEDLAAVAREPDLTNGAAQAAVMPIPNEADEDSAAWWVGLMHGGAPRLQIIAKLPFWGRRSDGVPTAPAYVVAPITLDASEHDHGLIGIETPPDTSTARVTAALKEAGFEVVAVMSRRSERGEPRYALAEVIGLIALDDPRIAALSGIFRAPAMVLGGFAVPITELPQDAAR
ncbi:MAG: chorismate mutase [Acidiphilium sp. 34-60-192]|nr:MAG: chorismate mutase [Acidiphilium sp. 34-60-192]